MKNSLKTKIRHFLKETDGPTTVEYAFLVGLIAIICMASLFLIGNNATNVFEGTADQLEAEIGKGS